MAILNGQKAELTLEPSDGSFEVKASVSVIVHEANLFDADPAAAMEANPPLPGVDIRVL